MREVKTKVIYLLAVLAFLVVACMVGWRQGTNAAHERQREWERVRCKQLADLDRSFLRQVRTQPGTLVSGKYILETRFPGEPAKTQLADLTFSNGRFLTKFQAAEGNLVTSGFTQEGNVVSVTLYDMDEGPSREYVGLMDGNVIWGRVYVMPGEGWWEGKPSAIGVWRLYSETKSGVPSE